MHAIYELKESLCDELEEYGKKDKLDLGAIDVIDKLAHTIKNLDKIIESYEEQEYSMDYDDGMSYEGEQGRGGTLGGGSSYARRYTMARGRGRNARRDSMGRYSSAGDSQMMISELRELMHDAPNEKTKMEFKKFIQKMEQME